MRDGLFQEILLSFEQRVHHENKSIVQWWDQWSISWTWWRSARKIITKWFYLIDRYDSVLINETFVTLFFCPFEQIFALQKQHKIVPKTLWLLQIQQLWFNWHYIIWIVILIKQHQKFDIGYHLKFWRLIPANTHESVKCVQTSTPEEFHNNYSDHIKEIMDIKNIIKMKGIRMA